MDLFVGRIQVRSISCYALASNPTQIQEPQQEQCRQQVHEPVDLAELAPDDPHQRVCRKSECQPVGDAEG